MAATKLSAINTETTNDNADNKNSNSKICNYKWRVIMISWMWKINGQSKDAHLIHTNIMFDNNKDGINKNNSGKNNIHVRIMKKKTILILKINRIKVK